MFSHRPPLTTTIDHAVKVERDGGFVNLQEDKVRNECWQRTRDSDIELAIRATLLSPEN